ncbi:hypothetical protein PAXRUDRAFT_156716 [Paxillus rubicundulus Ve08.2h10]|uniref:Unplaced genomic scaffold scaffold_1027, whole genome shotgun sequence n=1 Tax=Paxillus rubicundulus Ve08.2h10 TaxID=930991 RepID=A0A0D0DAZ0_9AGAM|nr:hypothetical protein PAXRUDRAFT_156716 [Paxillus rubicundulus Ve08.2h10]
MAEIPQLRMEGQNWSSWSKNLEWALSSLQVAAYIKETMPNLYDEQLHALANSNSPSYSAYEGFEAPTVLFKKPTSTTGKLQDIQSTRTMQEAAYSVQTANNHCDDNVSNGSGRWNDHILSSNMCCQCKWEPRGQEKVEGGESRGRGEKVEAGRIRKQEATARGLGEGSMNPSAGGISLLITVSSLDDESRNLRVCCTCTIPQTLNTPHKMVSGTAADTTNPNTTSARPTEPVGAFANNDVKYVKEETQGGREPVNENGKVVDIHCTHVMHQKPQLTYQTAINDTPGILTF